MQYHCLTYQTKDSVAIITLNRPEVLNSLNAEIARELSAAIEQANSSASIRAVLLTANGKGFCAGQDIEELRGENPPSIRSILSERLNPIVTKIRNSHLPFVCAVNGVAAGAGASLALSCDIVLASEKASFIQSFIQVGLIPDSGGSFMLPRLVGLARATALTMLGEKLTAVDAANCGLIYKVVTPESLADEALAIATKLANQPTKAIAAAKQIFNSSWQNSFVEQVELELETQCALEATADYREGVAAFLEKRKPNFTSNK